MKNLISRALLFCSVSLALILCAPGAAAAKRPELELAGAVRPILPTSHVEAVDLPNLNFDGDFATLELDEADTFSSSGFVSTNPDPRGGQAGGSHSAALTWILSIDDTTTECAVAGANCSQNVYRANGACSQTSPVFVALSNLGSGATTFTDTTITPGTWCYAVTFVIQATESTKDTATVSLQPAPATGLAIVAH